MQIDFNQRNTDWLKTQTADFPLGMTAEQRADAERKKLPVTQAPNWGEVTVREPVQLGQKYREDQARDEGGRFADEGGGSASVSGGATGYATPLAGDTSWLVPELPSSSPSGYIDSPTGILQAWFDAYDGPGQVSYEARDGFEITPDGARAIESATVRTEAFRRNSDSISIRLGFVSDDPHVMAMAYEANGEIILGNQFFGEGIDSVETTLAELAQADGRSGWHSSGAPDELVVHEIGHLLQSPAGLKYDRWPAYAATTVSAAAEGVASRAEAQEETIRLLRVASTVSDYATRNPGEFVAETFNGLAHGKTYGDDVMTLYRALGGREKVAAKTVPPRLAAVSKYLSRVMEGFELLGQKYREDQEREPAGTPEGGRFAGGGSGFAATLTESPDGPEASLLDWMGAHPDAADGVIIDRGSAPPTADAARAVASALVRTQDYRGPDDTMSIIITDTQPGVAGWANGTEVVLSDRYYAPAGVYSGSLVDMARQFGEAGYYSSGAPDSVIIHEIGHVLRDQTVETSPSWATMANAELIAEDPNYPRDTASMELWYERAGARQDTYSDTAARVSSYAARNPDEFVAEVFNGIVHGRDYDDDVMTLYRRLGGREKMAAKATDEYAPIERLLGDAKFWTNYRRTLGEAVTPLFERIFIQGAKAGLRTLPLAAQKAFALKYSEDQLRDELGRFADMGGQASLPGLEPATASGQGQLPGFPIADTGKGFAVAEVSGNPREHLRQWLRDHRNGAGAGIRVSWSSFSAAQRIIDADVNLSNVLYGRDEHPVILNETTVRSIESALVRTQAFARDDDPIIQLQVERDPIEILHAAAGTLPPNSAEGRDHVQITINPELYSHPAELVSIQKNERESGFKSSGEPDSVIVHEIGHAFTANLDKGRDWANFAAEQGMRYGPRDERRYNTTEDSLKDIASRVSGYATYHPAEFVAEVFTGLVHGQAYDNEVMEMYRALGGRERQSAARKAFARLAAVMRYAQDQPRDGDGRFTGRREPR